MRSSLRAVSELLTCCGLGVLATRCGLLDSPTTRALAKCVYNFFLPAMLCTSVASTVASGAGWSLLPLPLAAWLQVGLAVAIVSALLGPRRLRSAAGRDVTALSSFGNSGVLPLIFADCLFRTQPALLARANALVAMFLLGWSPLFWTFGFSLLSKKADSPSVQAGAPSVQAAAAEIEEPFWEGLRRRVLTPPIIGCLVGIVVGALAPLRWLLVPPSTPLPLHRCLALFGKAYSPAALLVLASSLGLPAPKADQGGGEAADAAPPTADAKPQTVRDLGTVMLVRFLLLPLAFSALLGLAKRSGLLPPDPLRDFILTMQASMPSAQNAVLALQVAGEPARATRMARLLLVIYLAAALPVALVLSVALQSSGLLVPMS